MLQFWETSQRDNRLRRAIFVLHLAIFIYWWKWVHNGVSQRKEEGSDVSFPLQNHNTGAMRQQREALCLCAFHLHYSDSLRGPCHLVSIHFTSGIDLSHSRMTLTWTRKQCRTAPDNTDVLMQLSTIQPCDDYIDLYIGSHYFVKKYQILPQNHPCNCAARKFCVFDGHVVAGTMLSLWSFELMMRNSQVGNT